MTTHFEVLWKAGRFGKITTGKCAEFAMSRPSGYMATTTDKAKVDCSRCAKSLGITPAAKDTKGTGTCQCCFRTLKTPSGKLSVHGYERPGCGYIIGACRGQKHLPFEVSCEQTKSWRTELVTILEGMETRLASLKSGKTVELITMVQTADYVHHGRTSTPVSKPVTVKKGDKVKPNPFTKGDPSRSSWTVPAFETVLAKKIIEVEGNISDIKGNIEFLTGKIDSWKKVA